MTVLPEREMRSAPSGRDTFGPAATMRPARTTMVALEIGGPPVPSISRAPVKTFMEELCEKTRAPQPRRIRAPIRLRFTVLTVLIRVDPWPYEYDFGISKPLRYS